MLKATKDWFDRAGAEYFGRFYNSKSFIYSFMNRQYHKNYKYLPLICTLSFKFEIK